MPCFLAEARPLAFRPPFFDLPSDLCHAGDLAIKHRDFGGSRERNVDVRVEQDALARNG